MNFPFLLLVPLSDDSEDSKSTDSIWDSEEVRSNGSQRMLCVAPLPYASAPKPCSTMGPTSYLMLVTAFEMVP